MSKKLYKVLPIMIISSTLTFASTNIDTIIMEPNENVKIDIIEMHSSTVQNHNIVDEEIEKLEKEIDDLSTLLEEVKAEYNSKINKRELYSIVDNASVIFNDGSKSVFDYNKKVETMNYMDQQYENLEYTSSYFNVFDLSQLSGLSSEEFNKILKDTNMDGLGYVFVNIENEYNINGLFILAIAKQESGLGTSNMAITKNNVTGYMAYDHNTGAAKRFNSFEDCLYTTSRLISKEYLKEGGNHYNGTSIFDINVKYCSQIDWSINLINIMFNSIEKIK